MSDCYDRDSEIAVIKLTDQAFPPKITGSSSDTWERPIGILTWGLLLTSIQINLLYLQYILPSIGVLLLFAGIRSLKYENKWFHTAWIFSIITIFIFALSLVFAVSPFSATGQGSIILGIVQSVFRLAMLVELRKAIFAAFKKLGCMPARDPLKWACVWTVLSLILAIFAPYSGLLIVLALLIWDIAICTSIYRMGQDLDKIGYPTPTPSERISSLSVSFAVIAALILAVSAAGMLSNHLKLSPQEYLQTEASEGRTRLVEMGFPPKVLADLSNEDVSAFKDAICVDSSGDIFLFTSEDMHSRVPINDAANPSISNKKHLRTSTVYVELPKKEIYIIHHFNWANAKPVWQEGIGIWVGGNIDPVDIASGGLLYEKNGTTYKASYPSLQSGIYTVTNGLFDSHQSSQIGGAFSYPLSSQNQRGYVISHLSLPEEQTMTCASITYAHMSSPIHIPYASAEEKAKNGGNLDNSTRQSYTTYQCRVY